MTTLAQQQAALVAALSGRGAVPVGFDANRVQATARALQAKRVRGVAHTWPAVVYLLADTFAPQFAAYARHHTLPADGGPLADGRAFVEWLARRGPLDDAVRRQAFDTDLRFVRIADGGLLPRRGPVVRCAWWPESGHGAVAMHWPGHVDRRWHVRLRR